MNTNNQAYKESPELAADEPGQNNNPSENSSNQMNQNNLAYQSISQEKKINGLLEHRANTAGAKSSEKRRAIGKDTQRVEKVVKETLGGNASVYIGGSQKKGVNIGTSDLDLKIDTPVPMTLDDRAKLGQGLENEFGKENVDSNHSKIHVVKGKDIDIDIVPNQAVYFPEDFKLDKPGVKPFATNHKGRHAVRILKEDHQSVPGLEVEKTVLKIQQGNKGISLHDIIKEAGAELEKSWSEVANEIEKDVSLALIL